MTKASIILSSNAPIPSDSADLVLARLSPTTRQRRRFALARRSRERRGIILIFVVVLLMLLAIMGTAYLATSRADRMALTKNGALPGATTPRLADRAKLDSLFEATQRRIETAMIEDVFNVAPGSLGGVIRQSESTSNNGSTANAAKARLAAAFRQEQMAAVDGPVANPNTDLNRYYKNYDAPGRADSYLSSLLPSNTTGVIVWPWISAPLAGEISPGVQLAPFFADPRMMSRTTATNNFGFTNRYAEQPDKSVAPGNGLWQSSVLQRNNTQIESVDSLRSSAQNIVTVENSLTTRVYPALRPPSSARNPTSGNAQFIAGDADGDGIADGGLIPVMINPNASNWVDRFVDQANGVAYFVSYRVVDNSSQINVNTALTAAGDLGFVNSDPAPAPKTAIRTRIHTAVTQTGNAGPESPNLGFHRTNIGLVELMRNSLAVLNDNAVTIAEIDRLTDARFPNIAGTSESSPAGSTSSTDSVIRRLGIAIDPLATTANGPFVGRFWIGERNTTTAAEPAEGWFYRFRSFGDLVEQQLSRRPENVGSLRTATGTLKRSALVSLPLADSVAFAGTGGSLLNPRSTPADTENALTLSTRMMAANFSASTNETWRWFPANQVGTWFGWTKDFSQGTGSPTAPGPGDYPITMLDSAANARSFNFSPSNSSGLADINLPKSIRPLLTTRSGVTSTVPKRFSADAGNLPAGMPVYGDKIVVDPTTADPDAMYPAIKVSAATGTKEQLWRAYWSTMTQNYVQANSSFVSFRAEKNLAYPQRPATSGGNQSEVDKTDGTGAFSYSDTDRQVMADPYKRNYDAFLPPDRHPDAIPPLTGPMSPGQTQPYVQVNEKQMTLIRSALAACNTIDLRDADNDITAMTVEIGETIQRFAGNVLTGQPADLFYGARNALYARVYGTEKQLVITGVMIDDPDGDGVGTVAPNIIVEIFNPSDEALDLRGYYLAVANRGDEPATPDPAVGPGMTTDSGTIIIDATGHAPTAPPTVPSMKLVPVGSTDTTIAPGGFILCTNGAAVAGPAGVTVTPRSVSPPTYQNHPRAAVPNTDPTYPALPTQVLNCVNMTALDQLQSHGTTPNVLNRELVLLRTRRADGVPYIDAAGVESNPKWNRPAFSEFVATPADLSTLVPIDSVDTRSLNYTPTTGLATRHWYLRNTVAPNLYTANPLAWKCFYGGVTFNQRPDRLVAGAVTPDAGSQTPMTKRPDPAPLAAGMALRPADYAWREYPTATAAIDVPAALGVYRSPDPTAAVVTGPVTADPNKPTSGQIDDFPTPFVAPTIPIQNAKPQTVFEPSDPTAYDSTLVTQRNPSATGTLVDHPPFQFPYGSPFARNGDLLSVPFIGSYKIYRVEITGGNPTTNQPITFTANQTGNAPKTPASAFALYEFVALPADAVNVAPVSTEFTAPINPSVGRFDSRATLRPRNDWAADLFDYVTARKVDGSDLAFPDVPVVTANAANLVNSPLIPSTDQDGPVYSVGATANPDPGTNPPAGIATGLTHPSLRTPWIEWMGDASNPNRRTPPSLTRSPQVDLKNNAAGASGSLLIPGVININTAPPVVLRMLPWTVDPATGLLNQDSATNTLVNQAMRGRVGIITDWLETTAASTATRSTGLQHAARSEPPFGFDSLTNLSNLTLLKFDDPRIPGTSATPTAGTPDINQQLMRMGMLNPQFRATREEDFNVAHLNMDRVSNLASTRSDLFTVYVTVQAWTWVGDAPGTGAANAKQFNGSRLVGERRGSFIVDRSRISADRYRPSDLIVYPVDQD